MEIASGRMGHWVSHTASDYATFYSVKYRSAWSKSKRGNHMDIYPSLIKGPCLHPKRYQRSCVDKCGHARAGGNLSWYDLASFMNVKHFLKSTYSRSRHPLLLHEAVLSFLRHTKRPYQVWDLGALHTLVTWSTSDALRIARLVLEGSDLQK